MLDLIETIPALPCDLLVTGARVIDPESGLDGIRNIGLTGDRITYVGRLTPPAIEVVNATGLTLAPGFIDLHSHAQTVNGHRLHALDGVTTALELEAGELPVGLHYAHAESEGRPINFGFSVSWALARMVVMDGLKLREAAQDNEHLPTFVETWGTANHADSRWDGVSSAHEIDQLLALLEQGLVEGGIGIGVLLGYAPESNRSEYFRVAQLAKKLDVPVFTHSRSMSHVEPLTMLEGMLEIVGVAAGTGARMHICHLNSSSLRQADEICEAIDVARGLGNPITTEAYPYGAGSTVISAAFLAPEKLHRLQIEPDAIYYVPGAERVRGVDRLRELRQNDPGGLCVVDYLDLDDENDMAKLLHAVTLPNTALASDALPLAGLGDTDALNNRWPLEDGAFAHPRSMGTYAKTLRWLVRELGVFSLSEAVRRCSLIPAQILEEAVPAMKRKGRIQVGADADIIVFDEARVADVASYTSSAPSTGFRHVLVNGSFVVRDGCLVVGARPGRAVRSGDT